MKTTRKKMRGGTDPVALQNAIKNTAETLAVLKSMATPASSASASDASDAVTAAPDADAKNNNAAPNAVNPAAAPAAAPNAVTPDATAAAAAPESSTSAAPDAVNPAPDAVNPASDAVNPAPNAVTPVVTSATESSASETPETPKPARFTVVSQKMGTGFRLNLDNDNVFNDLKFAQQMTTIKYNVPKLQTIPNDPIKSLLVNNKLLAPDVANILNTYLDSNPETSPTVFTLPIPPISTGGTKKRKMMRRRMRTKRRNTMKKRNRSH